MKRRYWLAMAIAFLLIVNAHHLTGGLFPAQLVPPELLSRLETSVDDLSLEDVTDSLPTPSGQSKDPILLYGDTNRNGIVSQDDDVEGRDRWSWKEGMLLPFNQDDDNFNGIPDWQNNRPIDFQRDRELALLRLQVPEPWQDSPLFLHANHAARPYLRAFQRTHQGWIPIDLTGQTPLIGSGDLVLGMEATEFAHQGWNGFAVVTAFIPDGDEIVQRDRIAMRVTPWLMQSNLAQPERVFVSPQPNSRFLPQLQEEIEAKNLDLTTDSGQILWMQDTMEIGFMQFPSRGQLHVIPAVLNGIRSSGIDGFARTLLDRDFGWFSVAAPRSLPEAYSWIDWYGNLEVSPPLPGYPWGRIYYGVANDYSLHPELLDFLDAQQLQAPAVALDTSWLYIGHVDEIVSFIPDGNGSFLALVNSPGAGVEFLEDLAEQGQGDATLARGLSGQATVNQLLANESLMDHNRQLQQDHLNPILDTLKQEFQLTDDRIRLVPSLYRPLGDAIFPNLVNLLVLGDRLIVPDPHGAIIDGGDRLQEAFLELIEGTGLSVAFLDDTEYHELKGNIHCATNVLRKGSEQAFWSALPDPIKP
ncbi:MAG: protein-arginine deiminase [Phormidium sp. GEM2.Bin31]|nr:MAG: protein-arginine deiminase [Phormidium sp. GEM2.Bin31]